MTVEARFTAPTQGPNQRRSTAAHRPCPDTPGRKSPVFGHRALTERAPVIRNLGAALFGLALVLLVPGCRTSSMDRAVQGMSPQEKVMLEKLSAITKGMSRAEVSEMLGTPTKTSKHQWHYAVNQRVVNATQTYTTPSVVIHGPSSTKVMPGITAQMPVSTVELDSVATIFFKDDEVVRVRFVSVGATGFWLDVLK